MPLIQIGSTGEVLVDSDLADPISPAKPGTQALEVRSWRSISLDVTVTSLPTDGALAYPDHGSDWTHSFRLGPYMSGSPRSSGKVAAVRHQPATCPPGQTHSVVVEVHAQRTPVGPREPVGDDVHDTHC